MVIIEESEDVKTLEIGHLTFDESSMLDSVIQRGLGVGIDPDARKPTRPEYTHVIKEEICEAELSSQGIPETSTSTSHQSSLGLTEFQRKFGIKKCHVFITRIDVDQNRKSVETEKRVRDEKHNSDSDDTIIYSLGNIIKAKLTCETVAKRCISGHPSKTGFCISVHSICKKKKRTYLSCKIVGCKS